MSGPSPGELAIAAAGAAIVLAALADVFVTVFNYDGFSFLANRLHGLLWKTVRMLARPLPSRARHAVQRSFVGPPDLDQPQPLTREQFARQYSAVIDGGAAETDVERFHDLQRSARSSAGVSCADGTPDEPSYRQYTEWLPFAHRNRVVLGRVAHALGYEL